MQSGTKIERAEYDTAKSIYDKTLAEKLGKGYQRTAGASAEKGAAPDLTSVATVSAPTSKGSGRRA